MKFAVVLTGLIFVITARSADLEIIGPCSEEPLYHFQTAPQASTLGDLTVETLKAHQIPFQGDRSGIKSIENSPVGDEALEVLSDTEMRAYGWCVSVDGVEPGQMPDEVQLQGHEKIVWFYAFTFYDKGVWKQMCTPSYKVKSPAICQK